MLETLNDFGINRKGSMCHFSPGGEYCPFVGIENSLVGIPA